MTNLVISVIYIFVELRCTSWISLQHISITTIILQTQDTTAFPYIENVKYEPE